MIRCIEILDDAYEYLAALEKMKLEKPNLTDKEKGNAKISIEAQLKDERMRPRIF